MEETEQALSEAKRCSVCQRLQPLSAYNRNTGSRDRHYSICRECVNLRARLRYVPKDRPPPKPEGVCRVCGRSAADGITFGADRRTKSGRSTRCVECSRADQKARRAANAEAYRAYSREWQRKRNARLRALRPPREAPPKVCSRCGRTPDQANFHRNSRSLSGLRSECVECAKAHLIAHPVKTYPVSEPSPDKTCRRCGCSGPSVEWGHDKYRPDGLTPDCRPCRRQKNKDWYWRDPERARALDRANYYKDLEHTRRRARADYWRNPEARRARRRADYWRNPELSRHRNRVDYWRDIDHTRRRDRRRRFLYRQGRGPQPRSSMRPYSLDEQRINGGRPGRSLIERTADRNAPDPQSVVIGLSERTAAFGWMSALSADEQRILEAYADNNFDMAATADALGIMQGNARRQILSLQDRARRELAGAVDIEE